MNLYYEGSDGHIIDFMKDPISAQEPEKLSGSSWNYNTISGANGLGRIKRFYKDAQESQITLSIMTDDAEEFNKIMYDMHRTFDKDVRRMKPGKLWWNGFYKEVFVIDVSHDEFEELFEAVEKTIKFISVYPYWIKKTTYEYIDMSIATGTLDYGDLDYGYDYDIDDLIESIDNDCIDKANFEIKFYGPCQNPAINIAGHLYEMLTDIDENEYLTINSLTKKITLYGAYGDAENMFHARNRDSYIFEPIPQGSSQISRNKSLRVSITLFDERGEPEWI